MLLILLLCWLTYENNDPDAKFGNLCNTKENQPVNASKELMKLLFSS